MIYADLLTSKGEIFRVECPRKFEDMFWDSIENELKIGGWWSPSHFDGCTVTYLGHRVTRVNMGEIVATL